MPYIKYEKLPKKNIIRKVAKYSFFSIIMTCSPILINIYISYVNSLQYKDAYSYCPDICFMAIVTSSTSIRDAFSSEVITKDNLIFGGFVIFNFIIIVLSIVLYGNITSTLLSGNTLSITLKQFRVSVFLYIFSIILGFGIQVGGGIDG